MCFVDDLPNELHECAFLQLFTTATQFAYAALILGASSLSFYLFALSTVAVYLCRFTLPLLSGELVSSLFFLMRRGISTVQTTAASYLWATRRSIHRHRSPDRTFSQEIQDRQNTFQWSNRHVFRPHQHFSYDPSNWSRRLEEKTKKQHILSLVERVRSTQEHEAERNANRAAVQRAADSAKQSQDQLPQKSLVTKSEDNVPSYFFSLEDTGVTPAAVADRRTPSEESAVSCNSWASVSLQELVEELQRLEHILYSRRYAGNASLVRREHQEDEFRTILLQLFKRLEGAVLRETITMDACAFSWFIVLRHVELLIGIITESAGSDSKSEEAVQRVFDALRRTVLRPMESGGAIYNSVMAGELTLEALVELLGVAASPFVKNCRVVFQSSGEVSLSSDTLAAYAQIVAAAAQQRAQEAVDEDGTEAHSSLQEWIDPAHLDAWAAAVKRLASRGTVSPAKYLPALTLQVTHSALYVTRTLENVTGVTLRGRVKESLRCMMATAPAAPWSPSARGTTEGVHERSDEETRVWAPKAVVLDPTAPPRGVQVPPTECDDVSRVLSAATSVLLLAIQSHPGVAVLDERVRRLVTKCLQMTAQAPNYDLEGPVVVRWSCALLQTGTLMPDAGVAAADHSESHGRRRADTQRSTKEGAEDTMRLHLRLLLLLSRLSFIDVADRLLVGRLVLHLAQWPEPACVVATERAEWRRLRGLVMKAALDRLNVDDLVAAATSVDGVSTWIETLAFGEYDGLVPLALWRAACERYLPFDTKTTAASSSTHTACSAEVAHALLVLCARFIAREDAGRAPVTATANIRSFYTAQCVAACVSVMYNRPTLGEALVRSADAWDAIPGEVAETLLPLFSAMQAVVRRELLQIKVKSF